MSLCISMASSGSIRCTFRSPSRMPWAASRTMGERWTGYTISISLLRSASSRTAEKIFLIGSP